MNGYKYNAINLKTDESNNKKRSSIKSCRANYFHIVFCIIQFKYIIYIDVLKFPQF